MLQVIGISLATLICYVFLREKAPQFAVIITVAGVCIILGIAFVEFKNISNQINEILSNIPSSVSYVKLMIKTLLIVIISQVTSNFCRDNGQSSLSSVIEFTSKIVVISMVFPLFKSILNLIIGLIK